jgi:hypothetical protein
LKRRKGKGGAGGRGAVISLHLCMPASNPNLDFNRETTTLFKAKWHNYSIRDLETFE